MSLVDGHVYQHSPNVVMKSAYGVKIKLEQRQRISDYEIWCFTDCEQMKYFLLLYQWNLHADLELVKYMLFYLSLQLVMIQQHWMIPCFFSKNAYFNMQTMITFQASYILIFIHVCGSIVCSNRFCVTWTECINSRTMQ